MEVDDTELLSCPVCFDPYSQDKAVPTTLMCGHWICKTCVIEVELCPICRKDKPADFVAVTSFGVLSAQDTLKRKLGIPTAVVVPSSPSPKRVSPPESPAALAASPHNVCATHSNTPFTYWCTTCCRCRCATCILETDCTRHQYRKQTPDHVEQRFVEWFAQVERENPHRTAAGFEEKARTARDIVETRVQAGKAQIHQELRVRLINEINDWADRLDGRMDVAQQNANKAIVDAIEWIVNNQKEYDEKIEVVRPFVQAINQGPDSLYQMGMAQREFISTAHTSVALLKQAEEPWASRLTLPYTMESLTPGVDRLRQALEQEKTALVANSSGPSYRSVLSSSSSSSSASSLPSTPLLGSAAGYTGDSIQITIELTGGYERVCGYTSKRRTVNRQHSIVKIFQLVQYTGMRIVDTEFYSKCAVSTPPYALRGPHEPTLTLAQYGFADGDVLVIKKKETPASPAPVTKVTTPMGRAVKLKISIFGQLQGHRTFDYDSSVSDHFYKSYDIDLDKDDFYRRSAYTAETHQISPRVSFRDNAFYNDDTLVVIKRGTGLSGHDPAALAALESSASSFLEPKKPVNPLKLSVLISFTDDHFTISAPPTAIIREHISSLASSFKTSRLSVDPATDEFFRQSAVDQEELIQVNPRGSFQDAGFVDNDRVVIKKPRPAPTPFASTRALPEDVTDRVWITVELAGGFSYRGKTSMRAQSSPSYTISKFVEFLDCGIPPTHADFYRRGRTSNAYIALSPEHTFLQCGLMSEEDTLVIAKKPPALSSSSASRGFPIAVEFRGKFSTRRGPSEYTRTERTVQPTDRLCDFAQTLVGVFLSDSILYRRRPYRSEDLIGPLAQLFTFVDHGFKENDVLVLELQ